MLYAFCNTLCGRSKRLGVQKFNELVREADRRNVWGYKGLPVWALPFVLLALRDFEGFSGRRQRRFVFRFVLKESPPPRLEDVWESGTYHLLRVFDGGGVMDFPPGNPYPIRKDIWQLYSREIGWLGEERYHQLVVSLEQCFKNERSDNDTW